MTRTELENWLANNGWSRDKWGHYQITLNGCTYRMKLSRIAARYERKTSSGWLRISSAYYKNLYLSEHGNLRGLR